MNRHQSNRFRPRLEALEDRALPSASSLVERPPCPPAHHAAGHNQQVHLEEYLTVTAASDGVQTFEGNTTLGHLTAFLFPDNSFVKVTANGDQIYGQLAPASATTGSMTFTGGTGRFAHVSGSASYVVSIDPTTGATNVDVVGTLSHVKDDHKGGHDDRQAQPFAINGGGPAPQGIALTPDVKVPHSATGNASFLGSYTGNGKFDQEALVISPTGEVTANFQGTFTFVAANGDKLVTRYGSGFAGRFTGHLSADGTAVVGGQFDAIFVIDGAKHTGQFKGASGSWRMIAHADNVSLVSMVPGYTAPFDYTWTGGGTITLAKGKNELAPVRR